LTQNKIPRHAQPIPTDGEVDTLSKAMRLEEVTKKVHFRRVDSITQDYRVGDDVVPTDGKQTVKAVLFASNRKTGGSVVIKMRNKRKSFKDECEIRDWLMNQKVRGLILLLIAFLKFLQCFLKSSTSLKNFHSVKSCKLANHSILYMLPE
jgi:hypothetical protein